MKKISISLKAALAVCMCVFAATASWATSGVWNGTVDALWTNSANWSAFPFPSGADTASFTNAGNTQTTIDVSGLASITSIIFDSPAVAAYTIGAGATNSQTLVLADNGTITLTDTAANSQLFNCGLQLGTTIAGSTYTLTNANTSQTLTFNSVFGPASGGTAGAKVLAINGAGNITILGNITKGGATSLTLTDNSSGTCTVMGTNTFAAINMNGTGTLMLPGSNTVTTLNMNGSASSVIDIGTGFLALSSGGGNVLNCSQGGIINGTGKLWLSTTSGLEGYNYADLNVAAGKTLVINPEITGPGGLETWTGSGTFVLNGINTFAAHIYLNVAGSTISVGKIGNCASVDSNLGQGTNINFNASGVKLIYTGIGEDSNRILLLNNNATLDQSGTGTLRFTSPLTANSTTKTLTLQGSTAGVGEIAGVIPVGSGTTTALTKTGTGTWILSAANTYAGTTAVNGGTLILTGTNGAINASTGYTITTGGTLLLDNTSTANNTNRLRDASTVTLNGGTLCMTNNGGAINYRENAGALSITLGNSTIATTAANPGQSNILTFTSLAYVSGKINFTGAGLGDSDQNRIFIAGVTNGLMGAWATVNNTSYAAYSTNRGVYAFTTGFSDIAAEGGVPESVIPDNGSLLARINLPGVSGPITLLGARTNSIGQVLQNTTTNTTIVTINGVTNKLLKAAGLSIADGKAKLIVGVNENDGTLSALTAGGTLVLENNSTGNDLTVNAAIVNNTSASALSKIGAGAVVLKGTNTYSGNTYINEGVLTFGGSLTQTVIAAISGAGAVTRSGSGTLNLNAANTFTGGLTINEGTVITAQANGLGAGAVTNNSTLNLTGADKTYTGLSISLAGSGTNNVTLSTGNYNAAILNGDYSNFTGVWNIGVGRLAGQSKIQMNGLDNSAATINILSNATIYCSTPVTHYAKLVLEGGDTYESIGQLRLEGNATWAGPITLIGPITQAGDALFGGNGPGIISGVIDDLGAGYTVDKIGSGTLVLSGANTYLGPTWVKASAISVSALSSISGGASPLGAPTTAAQGRIMLGNTTTVGTLIYTGTGNTSDRLIDLAGSTGGAVLDQSGSGPLVLTGGMMISGSGAKTLTLQGSTVGSGEFAGAITNGAGSTISVTKAGTGTWTLSGTNAYSGTTTISAGTLNVSGSITNSAITMSGGVLDVTGTLGNGNVTINGGTGTKVIARNPTALGTGLLLFNTGVITPRLELKIDGGGTIALPNSIGGNSSITNTIDVNNNGSGSNGVIQLNGLNSTGYGNATLYVTGGNGYSLYIASIKNTAGGAGSTLFNPTTASLSLGNLWATQGSGTDIWVLDGTAMGNFVTGVISNNPAGGAISAVTKQNSSTWTLTGVNTYTGATTVNGGTLLVNSLGSLGAGSAVTVNNGGILGGNGTINGTVTANASGRLAPGGIGTVATFNLSSNLTMNGGTLVFDISNVATDKVTVAGALIVNNANIVDLSLLDGSLAEGTYTLMTYASKSGSGSFALDRGYPNATLTSDSTNLVLTVGAGGTGNGMTWKGNISTSWDGSDLNWTIDGVVTNFSAGNLVTFDDTASNFTVGSGSAVIPSYVAFNNTNDYTVSANIDGTAPFLKLGAGTTALTGLSTYNPSVVVLNAGMLTLGGASTLNNGVYAGSIFNENLLNYASSIAQTNSGSIAGAGSLIQSGSGTLTLSGSNTFSGAVTVKAGCVLQAKNAFALGTTTIGTTVEAAGMLTLSDNISYPAEPLNLFGTLSSQTGSNTYAGAITLQLGASIDVGAGSTNYITGSTVGAGAFTKKGLGTLRFIADPNHTGTCTVSDGTLELASGGSTDGNFIINLGATLRLVSGTPLGDYRLQDDGIFDLRTTDGTGGLDGSGIVTIGNNGAYTLTVGGANNQSGTFSGVIQNGYGTLSFSKNGTGTQILSGANTYTGATTVVGGTLLVNGSTATNSAVTVTNGCTLGGSGTIYGSVNMASVSTLLPGDANAIGTLTLGNNSATALTLNASLLRYDISNQVGVCDQIILTGAGNVVLNGRNIIQLNFLNGSAPVGDYTLMTFNSYTGSGSFALASSYQNASLDLTPSNLVLHVVGGNTSAGLSWKGNISGVWDGGILNWTNGIASVAYTAGAAVTFDDSATGNFTVTSGAAVSPASMFLNNSINDYTISANVSGTGPLVKLGSKALTLSNVNAYNPSSVTLFGTFTLSGASQLNNGNYASNINNNGTFTHTSSAAQTLSGIISGPGVLNKNGAGTLTLSGTNTYTGATTVTLGTLKIQNDNALGTIAAGTTVTNATLELAGDITTPAEALTLYGTLSSQTGTNTYGGAISLYAGAAIDVGAGSMLSLKTFTANGSFTKNGTGWLKFTVDPNGAGVMTNNSGVVELAQVTGSMDANVVVNSGATLMCNTTAGGINDANTVTVNAGGFYDLRQSDIISALFGAGTVTRGTTGAATLTVGGNNNGSGTFSGVIQDGSGMMNFTKVGTGTNTLSGANTYTGLTTVTLGTLSLRGPATVLSPLSAISMNAATLQVLHDGSGNNGTISIGNSITLNAAVTAIIDVGNNGANTGNTVAFGALNNGTTNNANASTITFTGANGYLQSFSSLGLAGSTGASTTLNPTTTSVTILGNVINQETGTVTGHYDTLILDGTSASNRILGVISDAAGYVSVGNGDTRLTKQNSSTWTLSGANTYRGPTVISAGTLIIGGAGTLGGGVYANTIANTGLFVNDSSATQTLSGVISGTAGVLRKTGSGRLILSAINTYTGSTSISNGVLVGVTGGGCTNSVVTNAASAGLSATLGVSVTDNTKQWICSGLTVTNAGVSTGLELDFGYGIPSTNVPPLKITGALTLQTTPVVLTIKSGNLPVTTTGNGYPLMTWGSGSAAGITLALPSHVSGNLVVIGTTNYLQITANTQPLIWASSGSGTWNTNTSNTVWKDLAGTVTAYGEATLPGDQVIFADTNLTADTVVTLDTIVTPTRVTVTNDAYSYTISGSGGITGPIGLTKSGTNTLTLGTANTFTGVMALNNGTLKLANAAALPAGNILSMAGKGMLDMNGNATALTNISASAAVNTITDSSGAGTTALSILNQTTTINATIKDGASKTVAVNLANINGGTAAFALNTSNTYSGGLTLKNTAGAGTRLIVGSPVVTVGTPGNITSSPFGKGAIIIGETATDRAGIYMNANNATIVNELIVNATNGTDLVGMAIRVDGTGNNVSGKVTANASLSMGSNTGTPSVTLTNVISGAGGVTMDIGGGTLTATLMGPNTYQGKTIVNKGTLAFTSVGNVGGGASALGAPTTSQAGTIALGNGGTGVTLLYQGMGHITDRVLEMASTTGNITLDHSGTNLLKFTSDLLVSGSGAKTLILQGATSVSTGELAGAISDSPAGAVTITKAGGSVWRLSGNNTFSGNVNVNTGILVVASSGALGVGNKTNYVNSGNNAPEFHLDGSAGPITLGTNISFQTSNAGKGSLHNLRGTNVIAGNITMTSGNGRTIVTSWADKLYISGNITPNASGRDLALRGDGDGEISGVIANGVTTNMPVFHDIGTGTWTLSGMNTYSGPTTISSGMLAVGNNQAFGVSNVVNLAGGNLGGAVGTWSITNTVNVQSKADVNTLGTLILTGAVTNNAALNKIGAGTLLLNGSKTGTGALTVSAGVLGGMGTIAGTVTNLATITAADTNSIGTLTVANMVMASNSTLFWNCNAVTQDVIKVTGTLTLPTVATVIVDEDIVGDLGLTPRVLFTFTTGPAPMPLPSWVVVGAPQGTIVRVGNNQVYLARPGGTMVSFF